MKFYSITLYWEIFQLAFSSLCFPLEWTTQIPISRIRMTKRYALFLLIVFSLLKPTIFAETPGTENQLKLIPAPKEVRVQPGSFHVRPTTRILVEFGHQAEDGIAAETLAEEIRDQSGLKLNITGTKAD